MAKEKRTIPTHTGKPDAVEKDQAPGQGSTFWGSERLNDPGSWQNEDFDHQYKFSPLDVNADSNLRLPPDAQWLIAPRKRSAATAHLPEAHHDARETQPAESLSTAKISQPMASEKKQKRGKSTQAGHAKGPSRQVRSRIKQETFENVHPEIAVQAPELAQIELDVSSVRKVEDWLHRALEHLNQHAVRYVAQKMIATIHPNKQTKNPYFKKTKIDENGKQKEIGDEDRGEETRPPYWHPEKPHVDPHHLKKESRIPLVIHLLHAPYRMRWRHDEDPRTGTALQYEQLFHRILDELVHREMEHRKTKPSMSPETAEQIKEEKGELLNQIIKVTKARQRTLDGGLSSATVLVSDLPEKKPRAGNKATQKRTRISPLRRSNGPDHGDEVAGNSQDAAIEPASQAHVAPTGNGSAQREPVPLSGNEHIPPQFDPHSSALATQNLQERDPVPATSERDVYNLTTSPESFTPMQVLCLGCSHSLQNPFGNSTQQEHQRQLHNEQAYFQGLSRPLQDLQTNYGARFEPPLQVGSTFYQAEEWNEGDTETNLDEDSTVHISLKALSLPYRGPCEVSDRFDQAPMPHPYMSGSRYQSEGPASHPSYPFYEFPPPS